jgi:hypothetical protein
MFWHVILRKAIRIISDAPHGVTRLVRAEKSVAKDSVLRKANVTQHVKVETFVAMENAILHRVSQEISGTVPGTLQKECVIAMQD